MSQNINSIHTETFIAGADMSALRNRFVKVSADNTVILATANGDSIIGVQEDIPFAAAGAQVGVCLLGTPQICSGASFAAGAKLTSNGSGKAVAATTGQAYHAIAIQAATAADELPQCKLQTGVAP